MAWYGLTWRFIPARSPGRPHAQQTGVLRWIWLAEHDVALDGHPVGALDGPQPFGDSPLAGGDGRAVAPAVGALGQALAEPLDLADVGFSLVGVRGEGELPPARFMRCFQGCGALGTLLPGAAAQPGTPVGKSPGVCPTRAPAAGS
jgi:hypothetical protein